MKHLMIIIIALCLTSVVFYYIINNLNLPRNPVFYKEIDINVRERLFHSGAQTESQENATPRPRERLSPRATKPEGLSQYPPKKKAKKLSPLNFTPVKPSDTLYTAAPPPQSNSSLADCLGKVQLQNVRNLGEQFNEVDINRNPNLPRFIFDSEQISSLIPQIFSVRWRGVFQESWQYQPKFLLYSAHFDARGDKGLLIRILTLHLHGNEYHEKLYCQIYYHETHNPKMSPVIESFTHFMVKKNYMRAFLVSCRAPRVNGTVPIAVSLVKESCQKPTNVLKISGSPHRRKRNPNRKTLKVGICGKALFFYNFDFSVRLIEWIKMLKLLGVSKIFLYKMYVHPNVMKVLEYYENEGTVKLLRFEPPPPYIQEGTFIRLSSFRLGYINYQSMYLNDCILRNKDHFDYLGVFDCDEMPILKKHSTLQEFIQEVVESKEDSEDSIGFSFLRKTQLFSGPTNTTTGDALYSSYIFSHVLSSSQYGGNIKSFYNTRKILWIGCHSVLSRNGIEPAFLGKKLGIPFNVAYMGHFEGGFKNSTLPTADSAKTEEQKSLYKFKNGVLQEIGTVASKLGIH